jgi:hypothetical protein
MKPFTRILVLLSGLLMWAGCTSVTDAPEVQLPPPVVDQLDPSAESKLYPDPPALNEGIRNRRRMDLDQLEASIATATGGIYWGMSEGDRKFDELAQTLGKPDYLDVTTEDLSPSMLFQKFLGDAARDVCEQLIVQELATPPKDRIFLVEASEEDTSATDSQAIESNLRYLLTRFHSQSLDPGSDLLAPWVWLFDSSVHVTDDPVSAWRTVCVGLITHPNFYSY